MNKTFDQHIPVLLNEAVDQLVTSLTGVYVDATFGRGSHARAILKKLDTAARLIAFDKDPSAIAFGKSTMDDARFTLLHSSFKHLKQQLEALQVYGQVNGILFDLGVSSPQLDDPNRGFSFMQDGVLDMRMDTTQGMSAKEWLREVEEATLADILWQYGDEKFSRRIARAIVSKRIEKPIETTGALAQLIKDAVPKLKDHHIKHPATRSFQAIRIFINQELAELEAALHQAYGALAVGGRLVVISFHSLEDRIVKQFIRQHEKGVSVPRKLPIRHDEFKVALQSMGKAIKPSLTETTSNPRSRSAILRIAEKRS